MRMMVLATEAVPADELDQIALAGSDELLEVHVLAPTFSDSSLSHWAEGDDEALVSAETALRETINGLRSIGVEATGKTGEGDTRESIDEALRLFNPERILVFKHASGEAAAGENGLVEYLRETTVVPVDAREISARDESGDRTPGADRHGTDGGDQPSSGLSD